MFGVEHGAMACRARQCDGQAPGRGEFARDGGSDGLAAPGTGHVRLQNSDRMVVDPLARQRAAVCVYHYGVRVFCDDGPGERLLCARQIQRGGVVAFSCVAVASPAVFAAKTQNNGVRAARCGARRGNIL